MNLYIYRCLYYTTKTGICKYNVTFSLLINYSSGIGSTGIVPDLIKSIKNKKQGVDTSTPNISELYGSYSTIQKSISDVNKKSYGKSKEEIDDLIDSVTATDKLKKAMKGANEASKGTGINIRGVGQAAEAAGDSFASMASKASLAEVGMKALSIAGSTALTMGIAFGINLAITGIEHLINKEKEAKEAAQDAAQTIASTISSYQDVLKTVSSAGETYEKYISGVDTSSNTIKNSSLTQDQYKEFLDASNQLADALPEAVVGYDAEGNAILNLGSNAEVAASKLKDLLSAQQAAANQTIAKNLPTVYADELKAFNEKKGESAYSNSLKENEGLEKILSNANKATVDKNGMLDFGDKDKTQFASEQQAVINTLKSLASSTGNTDFSKAVDQTGTNLMGYNLKKLTDEELATLKASIADMVNGAKKDLSDPSIWKNTIAGASSFLEADPRFKGLSTSLQTVLRDSLTNVDWSTVGGSNIQSWISEQLVNPIADSSDDVKKAYEDLFHLNSGDTTFDLNTDMIASEWEAKRNELIQKIAPDDTEKQNSILSLLGFGTVDESGTYKDTIDDELDYISTVLSGENGTYNDKLLNELTKGEVDVAYNMVLNSQFDKNGDIADLIAFAKAGTVTTTISVDIETATTNSKNLQTAITDSVSGTGLTSDDITNIQSIYGADKAAAALEKTENGIHLNTQALNALNKAQEATVKSEYIKKIDEINKRIKNLTAAKEEAAKQSFPTVSQDAYDAQIANLQDELTKTQLLQSQYNGLTSSYQKWINAQSSTNEGEKYDQMYSGLAKTKDLYDKGLVGTDDFKSYIQLMAYNGQAINSVDDLVDAYENLNGVWSNLFTEDSTGMHNFVNELSNMGEAVQDESGTWHISIADEDATAQHFQVSVEALEILLEKLSDYGFDVTVDTDNANNNLKDLESQAQAAQDSLKQLQQQSDNTSVLSSVNFDFNIDTMNLDEVNAKIDEIQNLKASGELDTSQLEQADQILAGLIQKKETLTNPATIDVDTTSMQDLQAKAESALDKFNQLNNTNIKINLSDESDIDDEVNQVKDNIRSMYSMASDGSLRFTGDVSQLQDAKDIFLELEAEKDKLNEPAILKVDTSQVDTETNNAIQLIQNYYDAKNNLNNLNDLNAVSPIDQSELDAAQQTVEQTKSDLDQISSMKIAPELSLANLTSDEIASKIDNGQVTVPASLQVTGATDENGNQIFSDNTTTKTIIVQIENKQEVDELKNEIDQIQDKDVTLNYNVTGDVGDVKEITENVQINYALGTNNSQLSSEELTETGTVNWVKGSVEGLSDSDVTANGTIYWFNHVNNLLDSQLNKTGTINYTTTISGSGRVNGTAHTSGTVNANTSINNKSAYASGSDWTTKKTEVALVGELGQELVVKNLPLYPIMGI